jgi:hypothetical protein
MGPVTSFTLHAALAAVIAALAASGAAAGSDFYLKIRDPGAAASGGWRQIELQSFSWGTTQSAARSNLNSSKSKTVHTDNVGDARVAAGDLNGDGKPDAAADAATSRTLVASHVFETRAAPLAQGSARVKVKLPWLDCAEGRDLGDAELVTPTMRYELQNVIISSCSIPKLDGASKDAAMEEVSFNYSKLRESPSKPSDKYK